MPEDCYCGVCTTLRKDCAQHADETVHTSGGGEQGFTPPADAHPLSVCFYDILAEAARMHDMKQRDYGRDEDPFANVRASEDFGIPGWIGCVVRANDKMRRLQRFAQVGELKNESVEDSLLDALVYFGIALALFREEQGK